MAGLPLLVVVAGPTATGKTELGIRSPSGCRGREATATVISADSRQVYRGLDIGTAKVAGGSATRPARRTRPGRSRRALRGVRFRRARDRRAPRPAGRDGGPAGRRDGTLPACGGSRRRPRRPSDDPAVRARLEAEFEADGPAPLVTRPERSPRRWPRGPTSPTPPRSARSRSPELRGTATPRTTRLRRSVGLARPRPAGGRPPPSDRGAHVNSSTPAHRRGCRPASATTRGYRRSRRSATGKRGRSRTARSRGRWPSNRCPPQRRVRERQRTWFRAEPDVLGSTPRTRSTRPSSSSDASSPRPTSGCHLRLIDDVADPVDA